ncbi:efflux RND transporter periplasmic adaptor subunit [Thiohalorhabdus methylotrophus]|uniref:Efflux RND transporter periplasmic adaptor subunit n=1 Tax=Thiohalorhabdus methylotrophus TaxID=3242694 RepID=A0ABV4U0C8_9GAMM
MKRLLGTAALLLLLAAAGFLAAQALAPGAGGLRSGLIALLGGSPRETVTAEGGGEDEAEEEPGGRRLVVRDGAVAVRLSTEAQERGALRTRALEARDRPLETVAYGRVVDIAPLVDLRGRYRQTRTELQAAEARRREAAADYRRLESLSEGAGNISRRQLQSARTRLAEARAKLDGLRRRLAGLRTQAELRWGPLLAETALTGGERFRALVERQQVLIRLTLPPAQRLPEGTRSVPVHPGGERAAARSATLVGPATEVTPGLPGETYYLRTGAGGLRTGMPVQAWVPQGGSGLRGVRVPAEAVVWYGGSPWVYRRAGKELFVRRPLRGEAQGGSWFVTKGLQAGDRVVTAGAQMLLSEELRAQIPEEDGDD